MSRPNQGRRGRPLGMKLSQKSKDQIAKSKTGQKHKEETKQKISKTLLDYFDDHPELRTRPKVIICKGCGIEFENTNPILRIYCDDCIDKVRHNGEIGSYKKTYELLCRRNIFKEWKLKVLIRDKFMCRNCGKVGQAVHHLIDIMEIKDIPELLYNPDIGLTLCNKCHGKVHGHIRTNRAQENAPEAL